MWVSCLFSAFCLAGCELAHVAAFASQSCLPEQERTGEVYACCWQLAQPAAFIMCLMSCTAGRVLAVQSFKLLAVLLMWLMAWPGLWRHPLVLVPIYLVRTAAANCSYPLNKSILMDFCPKVIMHSKDRRHANTLPALCTARQNAFALVGPTMLSLNLLASSMKNLHAMSRL